MPYILFLHLRTAVAALHHQLLPFWTEKPCANYLWNTVISFSVQQYLEKEDGPIDHGIWKRQSLGDLNLFELSHHRVCLGWKCASLTLRICCVAPVQSSLSSWCNCLQGFTKKS